MKKILLIMTNFFLMMSVSTISFSTTWQKIASPNDDILDISIDKDSVKTLERNKGEILFSTKLHHEKAKQAINGEYFNEEVVEFKGNCAKLQTSFHTISVFTKKDKLVYSYKNPTDSWQKVFPNSAGGLALSEACKIASN